MKLNLLGRCAVPSHVGAVRFDGELSDTRTVRNIEHTCAAAFAIKFDPIRNCHLPVRFPVVLSTGDGNKERQMKAKQLILAGCAILALSIGTARARPCDTDGKSANLRDAGAGPTPENTAQTTGAGSANTN
jgi:hypothetical protein